MNDDPDDIRASRFARIGALVRAHADAIVDKWSDAARSENESARYAHRDELRNELPLFLVQVGAELASWGNGHERQRTAAAVSHGRERWRHGWRLSELVEDYQILRIVMLSFLDEHPELPRPERLCAVYPAARA
ncbi:MAG: RsbRD N-terminal domain-containing protein [Planctomycetales bacterium]|nr:RsbRD N-terminal domain-containing protein [Planctomycetales bacterium]